MVRFRRRKEKEIMIIVMKMLYLYHWNVIQNGCISLSFLAAFRITLSLFSQTRSERHIFQHYKSSFSSVCIVSAIYTKKECIHYCYISPHFEKTFHTIKKMVRWCKSFEKILENSMYILKEIRNFVFKNYLLDA